MLIELVVLLLFAVVIAASVATAIKHWRPGWSQGKTAVVAGGAMPSLLTAFCVWLFLDAAFSSKEDCGVDACGMAMMFASIGLAYAFLSFLVGAGIAWLVSRRSLRKGIAAEVFE